MIHPALRGEPRVTRDVWALLDDVRAALHLDRATAEIALFQLERGIRDRFEQFRIQGDALADANARAVEIVERQSEIVEELRRQNQELVRQTAAIAAARQEVEERCRALAEANVDALFAVESTGERAEHLRRSRDELHAERQQLTDKVTGLEGEARALAQANADAVVMIAEAETAIEQLVAQSAELERKQADLQELAFKDALTGLFNHRYLKEQLQHEVARAQRYERSLSVVFVDADHFKSLNDYYGHATGDAVLRQLGEILAGSVRGADLPVRLQTNPFAVRYGGEEFVVILPETDLSGALVVAERLRDRVQGRTFLDERGEPLPRVTVSCGVAQLTEQDRDPFAMVKRADDALYEAKKGGRNRVVIAPPAAA